MVDQTLYPKKMRLRWRWDGDDGDYITYHNPATGAISILNPVGASIFAKCDGESTVGEIINRLADEFEAPDRRQVESDACEFISYLSRIGAVILLTDGAGDG